MKRGLLMAMLAASLTFGPDRAYAFPTGPCISTASQGAAGGISKGQLFLLLLPALASQIV